MDFTIPSDAHSVFEPPKKRGPKPLSPEEKARRKAEREAAKSANPAQAPKKRGRKPKAEKSVSKTKRGRKPKVAAESVPVDPAKSEWPGLTMWILVGLYNFLGRRIAAYTKWQDARGIAKARKLQSRQAARNALVSALVV